MAGRKKIYYTDEERLQASRERKMRYYWKHREKILEKAKIRYKEKKSESLCISNNE